MSYTLAGQSIISGSVYEPSVGVWHAELEVDTAEELSGPVTMLLDGNAFTGTVKRGGVDGGRWLGRVVGGGAKLATILPAKSYISCPLSIPLADVMNESGESLDAASSPLSSDIVPAWVRSRDTAGNALSAIATTAGKVWRVTRAGTILLSDQSFPNASVSFTTIKNDKAEAVLTVAPDTPALVQPATTVNGFAISYAVTSITASSTRQHLYYT